MKKIFKITTATILTLLMAMFLYLSDYYKAENIAISVLSSDFNIEKVDDFTILHGDTDTGLIFYPGAKVENIAYLPMLQKLQNEGITCVLVEMPFNMAIFDTNIADDVFEIVPNIENWYISGHSMGGSMASLYASKNPEKVNGAILYGAYIYGDYEPSNTLVVYGEFNDKLEEKFKENQETVKIMGGNHAQFGNYGIQKGDATATISAEEQQNQAVKATIDFIQRKN